MDVVSPVIFSRLTRGANGVEAYHMWACHSLYVDPQQRRTPHSRGGQAFRKTEVGSLASKQQRQRKKYAVRGLADETIQIIDLPSIAWPLQQLGEQCQ